MSLQDPFERELAEQLSQLADTHRPPKRSPDQVAAVAMATRSSRWRVGFLAVAVAAGTLTAVAVFVRVGPEIAVQSVSPSPSVVESSVPSDPAGYQYTCGPGHSFPAALLDGPTVDPSQIPSASEALTRYFEGGSNEDLLTADGWHLAGLDDKTATLISSVAYAPWGEPYYQHAYLARQGDRWRSRNYGGCQPSIDVKGFGATDWWPDNDQVLLPTTTTILANVTERACAGGQSSEDRLQPPIIAYGEDRIFVTFLVEPLSGAHTCPSNPPTAVRVELSQPIGNRELVDGGKLPWRDVRSGDVYGGEGAQLTTQEVTEQVIAILQANKERNAPEFDDVAIEVTAASVMTFEDAWNAIEGTSTTEPDNDRPVWLVRAHGPFVSQRGRGADQLSGTSGHFLIDDRTGEIIGMGFET